MGYMIEITSEKQTELMEHAEKAYKHIGKMLDCIESMQSGQMGQREGDEWYISQMRGRGYGSRDEMDYRDEMMGERRNGMHYTRYGSRYGNRESYPYYR